MKKVKPSSQCLYGLGSNKTGQIGPRKETECEELTYIPLPFDTNLIGIQQIACGLEHSMLLTSIGTVYVFGSNRRGELGLVKCKKGFLKEPKLHPTLVGVSKIFANGHTSAALLRNGMLMMWGNNSFGQTGTGSTNGIIKAPTLCIGVKFSNISIGGNFTMGVSLDGDVLCWGNNYHGQLGNGERYDEMVPIAVGALANLKEKIVSIHAGACHSCVVLNTDEIYVWGNNRGGKLFCDDYDIEIYESEEIYCIKHPLLIDKFKDEGIRQVALGNMYSLVLTKTGKLFAYGNNERLCINGMFSKMNKYMQIRHEVTKFLASNYQFMIMDRDNHLFSFEASHRFDIDYNLPEVEFESIHGTSPVDFSLGHTHSLYLCKTVGSYFLSTQKPRDSFLDAVIEFGHIPSPKPKKTPKKKTPKKTSKRTTTKDTPKKRKQEETHSTSSPSSIDCVYLTPNKKVSKNHLFASPKSTPKSQRKQKTPKSSPRKSKDYENPTPPLVPCLPLGSFTKIGQEVIPSSPQCFGVSGGTPSQYELSPRRSPRKNKGVPPSRFVQRSDDGRLKKQTTLDKFFFSKPKPSVSIEQSHCLHHHHHTSNEREIIEIPDSPATNTPINDIFHSSTTTTTRTQQIKECDAKPSDEHWVKLAKEEEDSTTKSMD